MTIMTQDQSDGWLEAHRRNRRAEAAHWRRSQFRLVVNRGITPLELPEWYRLHGRGL